MVRLGLVGCGRIGRVHADSIAVHPRAELARVYDPFEAAAQDVGTRFGAEWATDVDAVVGDPTIDAVVVASPTPTHVDLLTRAVQAGKAVLCEKPIDLDLARVDACRAGIGSLADRVMVGFNRRFDPSFRDIRTRVQAGELGPLEQLTIISHDPAPPPAAYVATSGGLFRDMTIHDFDGDRDDGVLRGALQLAEEFEVGTVVTMSGLPAAPGDRFPAWITTVWPPENLRLLEHQWTVAVDYWGGLAAEAQRRGVQIAVEMHANQLVYNVPALLKLRAAVGGTVGANFDPSHLLWMGADPISAVAALGDDAAGAAIHHVHAKDTRIEAPAAVTSRLETIPNEHTDERSWNYVAVGTGHPDGDAFWARFVDALRVAGYDGPLSIENEDYTLGQRESVALAVGTLQRALGARPVG